MRALAQTQSPDAESSFLKGLEALKNRRYTEAISFFQVALDRESMLGTAGASKVKYMSYLGLALTLSQGSSEEGLKICQEAVRRDFFDADLYCNLGIVAYRNRRRALAFKAFRKGLALKPKHPRIIEQLMKYDRRSRRVFSFLPRDHFLNHYGGKIRHSLRSIFSKSGTD